MGIFDSFLQSAPVGKMPSNPNGPQSYADYLALARSAAAKNEFAHPSSLFSWLSGAGRDAAIADADAGAPDAYAKLRASNAGANDAQLSSTQKMAATGALAGVPINPNNIGAALPDLFKAYSATMNGAAPNPTAAPAAPAAPQAQPGYTADNIKGYLTNAFGPGAITSGARTADQEAAAFGAPNPGSSHIPDANGDFHAFDVAPGTDGVARAKQIMVDNPGVKAVFEPKGPNSTGPHVHVQWPAQGVAPSAAPTADSPAASRLEGQRAMFVRMANMSRIMGDNAGWKSFMDAANANAPSPHYTADPQTGEYVDAITAQGTRGKPGSVIAAGEAMQNARATQAGTEMETPVTGVDASGAKTTTNYDLAHNADPSFLPAGPQLDRIQGVQNEELKALRDNATSASSGLDTATELYNAANGLYTGKGSSSLQNLRKLAQSVAATTGVKLDPSIDNDTSKFEQLKFVAQKLVAQASHDLSPRIAQNIYQQIASVKAGEQSSIKGLRDIVAKQIIPALLRERAVYGATSDYYQQHPTATNASAHVPDTLPLTNFRVHDVHSAKPGDFYVDPVSGNLRQRPAQ